MKRYSSFAIGSTRLKAASQLSVPHLFEDLAAALNRLLRLAAGNFSPDKYRERFPKEAEGTDSGVMPWQLFERVERKPAHGTTESWRYVFSVLRDHFSDRSTASITPEEADGWIEGFWPAQQRESAAGRSRQSRLIGRGRF
jgi:hypothetical protein